MADRVLRDLRYQEYPALRPTAGMLTEPQVPVALSSGGPAGSPLRSIVEAIDRTPTSWRLELPPSGPPRLSLSWVWAMTKRGTPISEVLRAAGIRSSIEERQLRDARSHGFRVDLDLGEVRALRSVSRFYPAWSSSAGTRRYQRTGTDWELHEVTSPFTSNAEDNRRDLLIAPTGHSGPAAADAFELALTLAVSASVGYGNESISLYAIGFDVGETQQLLKRVPGASSLSTALARIADQVLHRTFDVELRLDARTPGGGLAVALWGVM